MFGLYVHIPFCKAKCAYCDFASFSGAFSHCKAYVSALCREIEARAPLAKDEIVTSVYFGGGTPSAIAAENISAILTCIRTYYTLAEDCEITCECNPESATEETLLAWKTIGVNRVSMGVQSLNDDELKAIGRIHTADEAFLAAKRISGFFQNFSVDLMIGLPGQTRESMFATLERILTLNPPHLSAYGLRVEEGTPLFARVQNGEVLPDEDELSELYHFLCVRAARASIVRYEVSNFAKVGFECRHNRLYWLSGEYFGFGLSAASHFHRVRFENPRTFESYFEMCEGDLQEIFKTVGEKESKYLSSVVTLTDIEREEEFIMLRLRLREGFSLEEFQKRFHRDFETAYAKGIAACGRYLEIADGFVRVAEDGMYVLNAILLQLI